MAISKDSAIDFSAISSEMSWVTQRWMNATVTIVDPNLENMTWNEWTNTMTGSEIELWSGPARVQPIAYYTQQPVIGMSQGAVRRIRVQVPLDETRDFVRAGLQLRVTDGGEFADLQNLQFVISSAVNSSYAWLLTIECDVDVKSEI